MVSGSGRCHSLRTPACETSGSAADLMGDQELAEGGLLKRQSMKKRLNLGRRKIAQEGLVRDSS